MSPYAFTEAFHQIRVVTLEHHYFLIVVKNLVLADFLLFVSMLNAFLSLLFGSLNSRHEAHVLIASVAKPPLKRLQAHFLVFHPGEPQIKVRDRLTISEERRHPRVHS
jgi:hypothetical protein